MKNQHASAGAIAVGVLTALTQTACVEGEPVQPEIVRLGVKAPSACPGDDVVVGWKVADWLGPSNGGLELVLTEENLFLDPSPLALSTPDATKNGLAPSVFAQQPKDVPFTLRAWNGNDSSLAQEQNAALRVYPDDDFLQPLQMGLIECEDSAGLSGAVWVLQAEKLFYPDSLRITQLLNSSKFPLTVEHAIDEDDAAALGIDAVEKWELLENAQAPNFVPRPVYGKWSAQFKPPGNGGNLVCPPPSAWPLPEDFTLEFPKPGDPDYDPDFENAGTASDLDLPAPTQPPEPPPGKVSMPPWIALRTIASCSSE